ncbi:HAMP domain-containing protein [Streptomyces sp. MBT65]|nr:HAMP domain-containing protein [Streptomyces sp. MBT65]
MATASSVGIEIAGKDSTGPGWIRFGGDLYLAFLDGDERPQGPGPRFPDPPPAPGTPVTVPADGSAGSAQYRLATARLADGRTAVAAVDTAATEAAVRRAVLVVVGVQLLADVVLAVLGVLVVRRSLRPLEHAARTADRIATGDFAPRLVEARVAPKTEVGRLSGALNRMLDQIHAALAARDASEERLRQFVADASHELRTPLQSLRGYGELYQRGALPDTGSVDEAMDRMLAEVHRMTRLVESLLMLARFDEDDPDDLEPVDLGRVVTESCRDAAAVEPDRPWTVTVAPDVTVRGDEAQLRGVVANLLVNVRMHTRVVVEVDHRGVSAGHVDEGQVRQREVGGGIAVPFDQLADGEVLAPRRRLEAGDDIAPDGDGLRVGRGKRLGDRDAAEKPVSEGEFGLPALEELRVLLAQPLGAESLDSGLHGGAGGGETEAGARVEVQGEPVDVELGQFAVRRGQDEVVVALELRHHRGEFDEEEPGRYPGVTGGLAQRKHARRGEDDQGLGPGAGGFGHGLTRAFGHGLSFTTEQVPDSWELSSYEVPVSERALTPARRTSV